MQIRPAAALTAVTSLTLAHAAAGADAAYDLAMAGRKAATLAAVAQDASPVGGRSVAAAFEPYAALVRFGLWDELIAQLAPPPTARNALAAYLWGRGVALAARGRLAEARTMDRELHELATSLTSADGELRAVLEVAAPILAARIEATAGQHAAAAGLLRQAVAAEDRLPRADPPLWFFPVRDLLGAELLEGGDAAGATVVYREALERHPADGWSRFGLAAALETQHNTRGAARATEAFHAAWNGADVRLTASAFWFAGPDTTSCECQRRDAGPAGASGKLRRP